MGLTHERGRGGGADEHADRRIIHDAPARRQMGCLNANPLAACGKRSAIHVIGAR